MCASHRIDVVVVLRSVVGPIHRVEHIPRPHPDQRSIRIKQKAGRAVCLGLGCGFSFCFRILRVSCISRISASKSRRNPANKFHAVSEDFHSEARAFWLDRRAERMYTSSVGSQCFSRASRRQFILVGSHDSEEFRAVLLELNRFTALDTPRTLRFSRNLTPQEAQPCTRTFAVDARIARPKYCWKTGKSQRPIYRTEFPGHERDARLVPIAERYSCPKATT